MDGLRKMLNHKHATCRVAILIAIAIVTVLSGLNLSSAVTTSNIGQQPQNIGSPSLGITISVVVTSFAVVAL